MMQMKKYIRIVLTLLLMTSCVKHNDAIDPNIDTDDKSAYIIELPLMVYNATQEEYTLMRSAQTGAVLRGMGTEPGDHYKDLYDPNVLNENKIENLHVFIFNKGTGDIVKHYNNSEVLRENATSTTDGTYRVKLRVLRADAPKYENKDLMIVTIANATEDLSTVTTLVQLQQRHEQYLDLNKTLAPRPSFLMDGKVDISTITWGTDRRYVIPTTIKLSRALAKIRLRIGENDINVKDYQNTGDSGAGATEYEVMSSNEGMKDIAVKLVRYTNATSVVAGSPYEPQWQSETDYRLMSVKDYPATGLGNRAGKYYGTYPFYAGESDWSKEANSKNETYLMLRIKLRPKNAQTGDTGTYYYYRLPINYRKVMDGVPIDRLLKVERNSLYDVMTTIEQLGSLDEGNPVEVESHIALQPWPKADAIDGTIVQAHYLVVKEHFPVMANLSEYKVGYISSLPVTIEITEAFYEYYDQRGDYYKVVFDSKANDYKFWWYGVGANKSNKLKVMTDTEIEKQGLTKPNKRGVADGAAVEPTPEYLQNGFITIKHDIPNNFVPFQIRFKVTQIDTGNPKALTDSVLVTQYPPLFVTGRKSPGFAGGTSEVDGQKTYADFRFYDTLGSPATYQGSTVDEAQRNSTFNRITVKVPGVLTLDGKQISYLVGDPRDTAGKTKTDPTSNGLVSPQFIIATQHGMSIRIPQSGTVSRSDVSTSHTYNIGKNFGISDDGRGYGPLSNYPGFDNTYAGGAIYYQTKQNGGLQYVAQLYKNAEERCYNYFEGEYGTDGDYFEYYRDIYGSWTYRVVKKTFKYKGRWRIPTAREIELIDAIQDNDLSVTKRLMYGVRYWSAQTQRAYRFERGNKGLINPSDGEANVRCVFDTYMFDDEKEE